MNKSEKFWDKVAGVTGKPAKKLGKTPLKTIEHAQKYLNTSDVVLDYGCGNQKNIRLARLFYCSKKEYLTCYDIIKRNCPTKMGAS